MKDPQPNSPNSPNRMQYPLAVALALVIGLSAACLAYELMSERLTIIAPGVVGMGLEDAAEALDTLAIDYVVVGERHDVAVPRGHVLSQSIPPGGVIPGGRARVELYVSAGPEVRDIPLLMGMPMDEARGVIEQGGLRFTRTARVPSTEPEGVVIAQHPRPGARSGEGIILIVSDGALRRGVYAPDLRGLTLAEAIYVAVEIGIALEPQGGRWPRDPLYSMVRSQTPGPGAPLREGETIRVEHAARPFSDIRALNWVPSASDPGLLDAPPDNDLTDSTSSPASGSPSGPVGGAGGEASRSGEFVNEVRDFIYNQSGMRKFMR